MAFQMIPPRVSSSPPPLDSLPSVACTGDDDDDDEFGNFASHSTFDITGLSDKLPPTPEVSPAKHPHVGGPPGEKVTDLQWKSSDGGTVTDTQRLSYPSDVNKTSISLTCSSSGVNGEHPGTLEIKDVDDDDDYGDFSFCTSSATPDIDVTEVSTNGGGLGEIQKLEASDINSSQKSSVVPGISDSSPNNSVHSFSMIATPPPLDHVVDSVVVEDEFSRISPNPPSADDDEFGDFAACTLEETKSQLQTLNDVDENLRSVADKVEIDKRDSEELPSDLSDVGFKGSELLTGDRSEDVENISELTDRTKNVEKCNIVGSDVTEVELGQETLEADVDRKDVERECVDESYISGVSSDLEKDENLSSAYSLPVLKTGDGFLKTSVTESCVAQNASSSIVRSDDGVSEETSPLELRSDDAEKEWNEPSACISSREDSSTRTATDSSGDVKEGVGSVEESNYKDTNGDDYECDLDFGDFSKAEDDDDDLDFDDLREQVKSGKFGLGDSADAEDDFGDFYEYSGPCSAPQVLNINDDEDQEFGEFGAAAVEKENNDDDDDDFGDFAQVESEDGFGKFASSESAVVENKAEASVAQAADNNSGDDEFGDFASQPTVVNQSQPFKASWHDHSASWSSNDTPLLRKLEGLILKWIPKEPCACSSSENLENHLVPTLFQSVEDDAFVWRQLENLEASSALTLSWGNTQAQTLYLSSVNVDARNIVSRATMITLFGQKWSSSVPLFAQTLSFSPLTPAKPTENCGTLDGGNRGSVSPPILGPGVSPKFCANFRKDEVEGDITLDNQSTQEEQIPPANFDWTSSGLTNPLEGPAYNSSLFDMDILLSNSDIGKGATNALLASLEREFLSEGGEKGTSGHLKTPPAPSPLVQQILDSGMNSTQSTATPLQSLSSDIREVVEYLPKIGFMRSKVLMFPIRGED